MKKNQIIIGIIVGFIGLCGIVSLSTPPKNTQNNVLGAEIENTAQTVTTKKQTTQAIQQTSKTIPTTIMTTTTTIPITIPTTIKTTAPTTIPTTVRTTVYVPTTVASRFTCNCSKTCNQISSCEEAQYQLNVCGCTARDGDGDGIACDAAPLHCQN